VSINGANRINIHTGRPYRGMNLEDSFTVNASKPVQVFFTYPSYRIAYAPETFLSTNIQFYSFGYMYTISNLTIIAPLSTTGNILLDGQAITALQYRRIPNTLFYYYIQQTQGPAQLHTISTTTSGDRYMAEVNFQYGTVIRAYTIALDVPAPGSV
jgi:hypothetical protein